MVNEEERRKAIDAVVALGALPTLTFPERRAIQAAWWLLYTIRPRPADDPDLHLKADRIMHLEHVQALVQGMLDAAYKMP